MTRTVARTACLLGIVAPLTFLINTSFTPDSAPAPASNRRLKARDSAWAYHMDGNLDSETLRCTGAADIALRPSSIEPTYLHWRLVTTSCRGPRHVDWLHAEVDSGTLRKASESWELTRSLPGRSFCTSEVKLGGAQDSVLLACTWECRSAKEPCSGGATYTFTRDRSERTAAE